MSNAKQERFLKLYEPVHERFERFCRARVYGDMDFRDLINDTLLVAYDKIDTLRSDEAFLSFLFSISVRILSNNNRKKKELEIKEGAALAREDVNANTEADMEVYLLHKALAMLPEAQREAIILFELSGFTIKEISAMQEASESAVKQRLKRGRERLGEILRFESTNKTGEVRHG